mmetsp:Transcript_15546/g.36622  ORF Transcript_15546/g.36622 Transcript_15546/m.36622 type:complete len:464 (-) Transcript_15546:373-1764(-)
MIHYDPNKWTSMFGYRGSVLPVSLRISLPFAVISLFLKYLEVWGVLDLSILDFLNTGEIYGGFTFVLGFTLVFRTSQSYTRYWAAATAVHEMGSEWSDSCASLIAFASCSKAPAEDIQRYMHLTVRLFSVLHAMAMEEIAELKMENFRVIDALGLVKEDLESIHGNDTSDNANRIGHAIKTTTVLCWLKKHIVVSQAAGIIAVPPPILTRVFHELSMGLVEYHKAQQVVIWPFPYPYAQLNTFLIWIFLFVSPLVICTWQTSPWIIACFTLLTACSMVGLDCIAAEIEAPFGPDQNDLPCNEMMDDYNTLLLAQLNPTSWAVPKMNEDALVDFRSLTHPQNFGRTCCVDDCFVKEGRPPLVPCTHELDLVSMIQDYSKTQKELLPKEPTAAPQAAFSPSTDVVEELRELRRQQQEFFTQQSQQQREYQERQCQLLQHLIHIMSQRSAGGAGQWCAAPAKAQPK